jgi:biotin carboxyl carrier protein
MAELKDRYIVTVDDEEYDINLVRNEQGYVAEYNGQKFHVAVDQLDAKKFLFKIDEKSSEVDITSKNGLLDIFLDGQVMKARVEPYELAELRKRAGTALEGPGDMTIRAPMPGLVLKAEAKPGDQIKKGAALVIIEAMKMENIIKSPFDGKVKEVHVAAGQAVDKNDKLIELE